MKIDFKKCTEEELWKYVATKLSKNEVDVILVGGAVVSQVIFISVRMNV